VTRLVFHPAAEAELLEQALYYEQRSPGLGKRFLDQMEAAVELAVLMPGAGSPYLQGTRRVFPKDFPHSVVYRLQADTLVILAVAPFRRKPAYWRKRQ